MILAVKKVPKANFRIELLDSVPFFEKRRVPHMDLLTPSQMRESLIYMVGNIEGLDQGDATDIVDTKLGNDHRAMVRDERELYQLQSIEGMANRVRDYGGVNMNMLEHFAKGFRGVRREDWGKWSVTGAHWIGNAVNYHLDKRGLRNDKSSRKRLDGEVWAACKSGDTGILYKHEAFFKMNAEMGMVINYHSPEEAAVISASRQLDKSFVSSFTESMPVDPSDYASGLAVVRSLPVNVYLALNILGAPDFKHHQEFSIKCLAASGDHLKSRVGERVGVPVDQEEIDKRAQAHKMFQLTHGFGGSHRVLYHLLCTAESYDVGSSSTS